MPEVPLVLPEPLVPDVPEPLVLPEPEPLVPEVPLPEPLPPWEPDPPWSGAISFATELFALAAVSGVPAYAKGKLNTAAAKNPFASNDFTVLSILFIIVAGCVWLGIRRLRA